jgi:hypothetical protein
MATPCGDGHSDRWRTLKRLAWQVMMGRPSVPDLKDRRW